MEHVIKMEGEFNLSCPAWSLNQHSLEQKNDILKLLKVSKVSTSGIDTEIQICLWFVCDLLQGKVSKYLKSIVSKW